MCLDGDRERHLGSRTIGVAMVVVGRRLDKRGLSCVADLRRAAAPRRPHPHFPCGTSNSRSRPRPPPRYPMSLAPADNPSADWKKAWSPASKLFCSLAAAPAVMSPPHLPSLAVATAAKKSIALPGPVGVDGDRRQSNPGCVSHPSFCLAQKKASSLIPWLTHPDPILCIHGARITRRP